MRPTTSMVFVLSSILLSSCGSKQIFRVADYMWTENRISSVAVLVSASITSSRPFKYTVDVDESKESASNFAKITKEVLESKGYAVTAWPAIAGEDILIIEETGEVEQFYVFPEASRQDSLSEAVQESFKNLWKEVYFTPYPERPADCGEFALKSIEGLRNATGADTICFVSISGENTKTKDVCCTCGCMTALLPLMLLLGGGPSPSFNHWYMDYRCVSASNSTCIFEGSGLESEDPIMPDVNKIRQSLTYFPNKGQPIDASRCRKADGKARCR